METVPIPPTVGYVSVHEFFTEKFLTFYEEYIELLISDEFLNDSEKLLIKWLYEYELKLKSILSDVLFDYHENLGWSCDKFLDTLKSLEQKEVIVVLDKYRDSFIASLCYAYIRQADKTDRIPYKK